MKKALSTILAASMILASAYAASDDTPATIPEKPAPIVYKQRREKTDEERKRSKDHKKRLRARRNSRRHKARR